MISVCCVKWGHKYSSDYVVRLESMVRRNLPVEHTFVCVTDDTNGLPSHITAIPPLFDELKGSWHKVSLFSSDFARLVPGTVLFLDLDVVILDSLLPFLEFMPGSFCIIRDFLKKHRGWNSSVVRFEAGENQHIWKNFMDNPEGAYGLRSDKAGDQIWITKQMKGEASVDLWPDGWCWSYKRARRAISKGKLCEWPGQGIAIFHGIPKPHQVEEQWVRDSWR